MWSAGQDGELTFEEHAREEMARDSVSEAEVYPVIEDADDRIERRDGRIEYTRTLGDGRYILVILEDDERTVVTVIWNKRRSRGRRRR